MSKPKNYWALHLAPLIILMVKLMYVCILKTVCICWVMLCKSAVFYT